MKRNQELRISQGTLARILAKGFEGPFLWEWNCHPNRDTLIKVRLIGDGLWQVEARPMMAGYLSGDPAAYMKVYASSPEAAVRVVHRNSRDKYDTAPWA